uniref:Protein CLEC16A n=1 Tax=Lygus hesperus TaxID=30085 RepID=A0A0A9WV92_LYGHE
MSSVHHDDLLYLLSNNRVNDLVESVRARQGDQVEVDVHVVAFLKAISTHFSHDTAPLLYNTRDGNFPVFERTLECLESKDELVQATVRVVMVNLCTWKSEEVQRY